ncbi:Cullin-associated NEDD8-dissociated protein 1 [Phlyctochytrium planicorne]|nr:Cullin-associated NEDD8-dissociated protein 1 [Phlyctochytrium planicorne]
MSELLARFGTIIAEAADDNAKKIQAVLLPLLNHSRAAIRKRTTIALGHLVVYSSDDLFDELVANIKKEITEKESSGDFDKLRTFVVAISTLCRYSPKRLGKHIDTILPFILKDAKLEDDEMRENCLQALESFVLRCPTEITQHIQTLTALALEYIKYDPNYADDDEEEGMDVDGEEEDGDEEMADEDEEEDFDDEDYSDDDDVSWKVRRASAKLLAAIIGTRTELLPALFADVAPALISRFKEREESVRVEVLVTFITLIRQVGAATRGQTKEDWKKSLSSLVDPRTLLQQQVARLSKSLAKQLSGKSVQTRQTGFILLKELSIVLEGGLDSRIGLFIPAIESSLAKSTSANDVKGLNNPNLKIDVLQFLQHLFAEHNPEAFQKHLAKLVPPVVTAAADKFYKIASEALLVTIHLVKVVRPIPSGSNIDLEPPALAAGAAGHIKLIYDTVLERLKTSDVDLEVKERSISALGTLVSEAGDVIGRDQVEKVIVPLLIDRLRNELTRLSALKVIRSVTGSPILRSFTGPEGLYPPTLASEIAAFLRKSQRQLRIASLNSLEIIVSKFGSTWSSAILLEVLEEIKPIVSETDLNIFPLVVNVIGALLDADRDGQLTAVIRRDVAGSVVGLVVDSPHLVLSGAGLEALLHFWKFIVVKGGSPVFAESVQKLVEPVFNVGTLTPHAKQSVRPIAQSLASLCLYSPADAPSLVTDFIKKIEDASTSDSVKFLTLLTIGEVGRNTDISKTSQTLHNVLLELFASPSDEIKQAAAFALGSISIGNLPFYLPFVFEAVRAGGKRRYLVLVSLKEIIARSAPSASSSKLLAPYAADLWNLLFANAEEAQDEGTRTVIAECIGKLALSDPGSYLKDLETRLSSPNPTIRSTVVAAIRFTFTDSVSEEFDAILGGLIVQFLRLVQDPDLNVRRVSLLTLNSAAHNKPYLITSSLDELLPLLYSETIVKQELIHIVEMGPFKHHVDDGLDARKSAYECMFTLLETCLSRIEVFGFLDRAIHGLSDPSQEVKTLCHVILQRLASLTPAALANRLEATIAPLKDTINLKPKANAVKQEIEKLNDLIRSAVRTALILYKTITGSSSTAVSVDGASSAKYVEFVKEFTAPGAPLADLFNSVQVEIDAQHAMGVGKALLGGLAPMDLS